MINYFGRSFIILEEVLLFEEVDIVGRWGRVTPMKKKVVRHQERWGRVS